MDTVRFITTIIGLLVIAVPLCVVAIGVRRIVVAQRESARSLVKNVKAKVDKPLSNIEAARARAKEREQRRLTGLA